METPRPHPEHEWLQRLVGTWEVDSEPGSASPTAWVETVRPVGRLWIVAEAAGEMPEAGPATTIMTLGYDPARQRFVGTWIGSMMGNLWVYEGELDPTGRFLTLATEGPSFDGTGGTSSYRDVHELDGDRRVLRSLVLGADGEWTEFMSMRYRRTAGA